MDKLKLKNQFSVQNDPALMQEMVNKGCISKNVSLDILFPFVIFLETWDKNMRTFSKSIGHKPSKEKNRNGLFFSPPLLSITSVLLLNSCMTAFYWHWNVSLVTLKTTLRVTRKAKYMKVVKCSKWVFSFVFQTKFIAFKYGMYYVLAVI